MGSAFSAGEELGSHYQGFFCWVYFLSPFFPFFFFSCFLGAEQKLDSLVCILMRWHSIAKDLILFLSDLQFLPHW